MRAIRLASIALLVIVFLSTVSCATPTYHLSTAVNGQGNIMPASGDFLEGHAITILANPAYGWQFDHWEGALSGSQNPANVIMNADKNITAYFVETGAIAPSEFETYTDDEYGFSISVPDSWITIPIEEEGASGIGFVSLSLCSGSPIAAGVVVNETHKLSLQSYYEMVKNDTGDFEEFALLSEEEITIDGIPAMKAIYTGTQEGLAVQVMACILVKEGTGWDIELGCAPECWDIYEDTFDTMANSFQVLD